MLVFSFLPIRFQSQFKPSPCRIISKRSIKFYSDNEKMLLLAVYPERFKSQPKKSIPTFLMHNTKETHSVLLKLLSGQKMSSDNALTPTDDNLGSVITLYDHKLKINILYRFISNIKFYKYSLLQQGVKKNKKNPCISTLLK